MNVQIFAVFDSKAQTFGQPFFCINENIALRSWREAVNDPATQFCKYPEDFSLFQLGEFNDQDASFKLLQAPLNLGLASLYKLNVKALSNE